ncbi:ROK family transcriptional regulator [Sulfitobacter sp. D35]|uniref:ROK family transcriptional regulator n=1 Tax=Sulfitobacter sp. D35 TaxID=3083252 RepID=UPI00296E7193|nr:ROK family transcriptional regulator [Sulfitobacter sp. D35]MDW4498940.1 ROK family transcriptional regulator [Sulfitobacter sp. D35]
MPADADTSKIAALRTGINQSGLRDFNERLMLSMIQRYGAMPRSELARISGLSLQTASVITRKLEQDGLLAPGAPTKGKVGKPSIPMALAPDGVFSLGLKIGRRSAELMLIDFVGAVRKQHRLNFPYPNPKDIFDFFAAGLSDILKRMPSRDRERIAGLGVAAPHEIWNWQELVGATSEDFQHWRRIDFRDEIARFTALPVTIVNDATAACRAEHHFGRGKEFRDYAYFFVGAFVGGGVVINQSVHEGAKGNAGAFGALRMVGADGKEHSLIDEASIFRLETALIDAGLPREGLWQEPQDWSGMDHLLDPWIERVGKALARAALSVCAVIDFDAILIDGAFPADVRNRIVGTARDELATLDQRGLIAPRIEEGTIGLHARSIGAACGPIFDSYFMTAT